MTDQKLLRDRVHHNAALLACAFLIGVSLACVDGSKIGFFKKFVAPEFVSGSPDAVQIAVDLPKHEAFLHDHLGYEKTHVVLTGSCELLSIWAEKELVDPRFSIARQLDNEFQVHGMSDVRVINLSVPLYMAGYNLHMFLRFLDDPRYRVFVWQNEFSTDDLHLNRMVGDPYIYAGLMRLRRRFPYLREIDQLLETDFKYRARISHVRLFPELPPSEQRSMTRPEDVVTSVIDSLTYLRHNLFQRTQNEQFKSNTLYVREFRRRLAEFLGVATPPPSAESFQPLGWKSNPGGQPKMYMSTPEIQDRSGEEVNRDSIRTLRLMGQLASYYHKSIYLYFGPEGNRRHQQDDIYTLKYKEPIIHALRDLKTIHVMDLTDLPIQEGVDSWSEVNLTYSGNKKVAAKMFDLMKNDNYLR